ncbi:hypothetical protein P691DRAFT_760938 [Macrolepiota fuliginosa MF-IS2]|uniref:Uncharacterized protein n=1 Tax=Macrolepiota fuliginosa MF-IS2 TaxID=1400762 RepID=A0A9P5XDF5_9AGAR|nr:hypothetical protein P691DRAFT_760938 [Macrolepiota fuliginosa MF-IS2]
MSAATFPIESFFYGIFVLLSGLSATLFWYRYKSRRSPQSSTRVLTIHPVLVLGVLLFTTVTGHWIVSWTRGLEGGVDPGASRDNTRPVFFSEMLKSFFVVPSVLLADTAFIYRLWMVWGRNPRIIIIPCITLLGLLVTGCNIIIGYGHFVPGDVADGKNFDTWILVDLVFTICTNVYCTGLISWKIWSVSRAMREIGAESDFSHILSIVIESAAFYTSWMAVAFVLNLVKSPVEGLLIDSCPSVAGISFMLINVRVGLGWASTQSPVWEQATQASRFESTGTGLRFALASPLGVSRTVLHEEDAANAMNL